MRQRICLIRSRQDNILAIYIREFFKLSGFIIRDIVEETSDGDLERISETYDYVIDRNVYGTSFFIPHESNEYLYERVLKELFKEEEVLEEMKILSKIYEENQLFYYLYNKGNLKFVEEYYPLSHTEKESTNRRKEAMEMCLEKYQKAHNETEQYITQCGNGGSLYCQYMLIKLRYKINDISKMLGKGRVYRTQNMLKRIDKLLKEEPDFVRGSYLRGHICVADQQYSMEAEGCYIHAIYVMLTKYMNCEDAAFLYYQLGRYYEKQRKSLEDAEFCYEKANTLEQDSYRILYKKALMSRRHDNIQEAIVFCEQILDVLGKKYGKDNLSAKQQIYQYKCYRLLGDLHLKSEEYTSAESAYKRALKISETENNFYGKLGKAGCFERVFFMCMPKQPLYRELVRCALQYGDDEAARDYLEKMKG